MFQALIKGKLTRSEENMEDLLTSNVFGIFKYLTPSEVLLPFIGEAIDLRGKHLADHLPQVESAEYKFWPWLTEKAATLPNPMC